MKKLIKQILSFLGIKVTRDIFGTHISKTSHIYKKLNFDDIYKVKIKKNKPIIFDVGANQGQSILRFKKLFPQSTIHAFEPIEKEFNNLKKKFGNDNSIFLNNFAIGDNDEEKDFYITANTGNSSFNKLNLDTEWIKIRSKQYNTTNEGYTKEIKRTKIKTLDDYCKKNSISEIDLLKVDTQGYEDKVLNGSGEILKNNNIYAIEIELMFDKVYEKHLNFSDVEKYLIPNNFILSGLEPNGGFRNMFEGHMFAIDALYFNKNFK